MAQSNRGKQTSAKRKTNSKSSGKSTSRSEKTTAKAPLRREIMAAVCFFLAAFTFIAYFNDDGAFIGLFAGFVRGLIGHGFFYLAPVLLLCAVVLTFHRGRPVAFRISSTLILCLLAGALTHLITRSPEYAFEISFSMIPELWVSGLNLESGGALSGSIADIFGWLFGSVGAIVLLVIASLFLLLVALNKTVVGIVDAIRNRTRAEYIPEPMPEHMPAEESQSRQVQKRVLPPLRGRKAIDISIDSETEPTTEVIEEPQKEPLFKPSPTVRTPDQLINEYASQKNDSEKRNNPLEGESGRDKNIALDNKTIDGTDVSDNGVAEVGADDSAEQIATEDLPLDIPFMESKRRKRPEKAPIVPEPPTYDEPVEEAKPEEKKTVEVKAPSITPTVVDSGAYVFPPLDLLAAGSSKGHSGDDEVRLNSERLESAFQSFGVNVKISNATCGPAVTRYEAAMEAGVKLSKLTNLADDIALSLGTSGVRIAAMPNMISTVGIEVPNKSVSVVYLREIIESTAFVSAKSKLTFAIGKNISGEAIVGNASKMPHMLVAGTTGSGKSVCLNSIILSLLYKANPEEVRFIMIDPKMVEFNVYNEIPHLLVPVVTDVKKASGALQWAVFEMTKRYTLFKETNARDLEGYNKVARESEELTEFPQIVIIIDELADLMMTAAKEVEESVCRVAQMGRAAGMHLIIATQSPRADVITGLMKANIPSRISFKVSSALESRIILDAGGNADKLVGNGDMLFAPIGSDKPMRVQGTWVSDAEREKVVEFIKKSGQTQYSEEVMDEIEKAAIEKTSGGDKVKEETDAADYDELLPQAVELIFETGQASVSMLQRRLKLGFSRAGRIVDQMEQMGVVGPYEGSKPRALLVTKDQWRQMQYISGNAPEDSIVPEPVVSVTSVTDERPLAVNPLPLIVNESPEDD
ncbi:MAG: DNA translocase FtsK [Oscillospiraceae bacterium]|nr:DNA translocase FtsK [Oscillospiraceae bacterium]